MNYFTDISHFAYRAPRMMRGDWQKIQNVVNKRKAKAGMVAANLGQTERFIARNAPEQLEKFRQAAAPAMANRQKWLKQSQGAQDMLDDFNMKAFQQKARQYKQDKLDAFQNKLDKDYEWNLEIAKAQQARKREAAPPSNPNAARETAQAKLANQIPTKSAPVTVNPSPASTAGGSAVLPAAAVGALGLAGVLAAKGEGQPQPKTVQTTTQYSYMTPIALFHAY